MIEVGECRAAVPGGLTKGRWRERSVAIVLQQRGLHFNDRPHFFKFTGIYELPFGKGKKFGAGASGEPNDLPGNVIQRKDPRVATVDWKANQVRGWSPCVAHQFNDGTVAVQPYSIALGCSANVSDASWLMLPNYAPRSTPSRSGQIRKHHAFTLDSSVIKNTQITERLRIQFPAEAFNLFNLNYFGRDNCNTDPNNPNFGTVFPALVSTQNSNPRQVQLGIKAYW